MSNQKAIFPYVTLCLWLFCSGSIYGQTSSVDPLVHKFERYTRNFLQEKIYLHTDQSVYLAGEYLWYKLYNVNGSTHQPLSISKVAYVEILDQQNKSVFQVKVALNAATGNGSVFLPASLSSGNYVVRAYTNWMKNSGPEYFFNKPITIINTFKLLGLPASSEQDKFNIQFFPEGGNLVQGITSKVAFHATDKDGNGMDFQGFLLAQEDDTIARFQPQKFGLGHFSFTPLPGKLYKAVVMLAGGKTLQAKLPTVIAEGYAMQLQELASNEIKITVKSQHSNISGKPSAIYLIAHTRQVLKVAKLLTLEQNEASVIINKNILGDGISHITIFNEKQQPVCERLYFKLPDEKLIIAAKPDQEMYASRAKVKMSVLTQNSAGTPHAADLSVAVYKLDSMQKQDEFSMPSYLWLSSDLTGKVESPHYYFTADHPSLQEELDNLMLTHGWRKFKWQSLLGEDSLSINHLPEYEGHLVQGRIIHASTQKPAPGIHAYLSIPGRYPQLYISQSNAAGEILFAVKQVYGTKQLVTQTNSQQNGLYRIELLSPFSQLFAPVQLSSLVASEKWQEQILNRSISMQTQNTYFAAKKNQYSAGRQDTSTFYGNPDARYHLDDYTRFPLMEDVLKEYVPGVQARKRKGSYYLEVLDLPHKLNFAENPLVIVDGVPLFDMDRVMAYNPLKVKRLDVLNRKYFLGPASFSGVLSFSTYTGEVADLPLDSAAVILDFEGLQQQRVFYTPTYTSSNQIESRLPDFRQLMYWSPNIQTTGRGKTEFEFYTSDLEGTYILVIEGITKEGQAAYSTSSFKVQGTPK